MSTAKFGRSRSNYMGVDKGSKKKFRLLGPLRMLGRPFEWGAPAPGNMPLARVTIPNLVIVCQTVFMEICTNLWSLASCLSRSLKVTGTGMDRSATYDFLLVIHSNHGPIS